MHRSPRGFTLIELLVVVMLIAVVTAVAVPRLADQIGGARVRKAARDFCNLSRLARSKAAAEVKEFSLVLDTEGGKMLLRPKEEKEATGSSLVRRTLPTGVSMKAVDEAGSASGGREGMALVFKPNGTATSGRVIFRDSTGRVLEVRLDAVTGRAKVKQ